jgi:site-specific recombinase XerD
LRDWGLAQQKARVWESEGVEGGGSPTLVKDACEKFLKDAEARGLREPTLYKYRLLFRRLQEFAEAHGLTFVRSFDVEWTRKFRESWPNVNLAARKKLENLRAFFRFAEDSGWIDENPATRLKPPKITGTPTLPLTEEEMGKILEACDSYPNPDNRARLRALVLLLRHSGLRIGDACTLSKDRIEGDTLELYTAKTGVKVRCPLPSVAIQALTSIPCEKYFFWTGNSKPRTVTSIWQEALKKLFELAGVPGAHAHRYRDSFAIGLLQAGVPMERVSILLGHQSIRVTEKHYAPFVKARAEQLEEDVRKTWTTEKKRARTGHVTLSRPKKRQKSK